MQDDFFDDYNDDSEELENKELVERFERMLNNNTFDFFDCDEYALLFDHYFLTGKINKAQKALSMGLKQYPDSVILKFKKVHYLIYSQKQDDALILLNETENHILDNTEMLLEQAYLYSQLKQYDKSIKIYKQMLSHDNEERNFMEDIYLGLAEVYEQKGEAKKTLRCLQHALELDPENEYLISSVSDAFYDVVSEDEKHEIVDYFMNFVNKHSFSSPAWCCLGIAYYETNMYEKAVESFDYALALDDKNEEAMLYQMKSYYKLNEHKKANEVFLTLLQITRYKDLVWNQLGNCFYENEAFDNAMLSYQKSIDENENFSASYSGMAMVYAAMKNFSKAIENIQIAIELDGHNVEYWLMFVEYLSSDEQYDEAEEVFQNMAEQFPNEEELWLMYSDFYVLTHNLNKAIEMLYKGIEKQPDNISYLYRMANYFYLKNDIEQANSYLTLAYMTDSELLKEFFEYDKNMYNVPDVIEFLSNIKNNDE